MRKTLSFHLVLLLTGVSLTTPCLRGNSAMAANESGSSLQKLLATMPPDSWQRLNATTGNGSPYNVLKAYGFTMANFNGALGNPFACDGTGPGCAASVSPGGADPINVGNLFAFGSVGIRASDGKIVSSGGGGHAASNISATFSFDSMAAAERLVEAGGYGAAPSGEWEMPVKPSKLLNGFSARPSGNQQTGQQICVASWEAGQSSPATIRVTRCVDQYGNATNLTEAANYVQNSDSQGCWSNAHKIAASVSGGAGTITINQGTSCSASKVTLHINPSVWYTSADPSCHTYYTEHAIDGGKWVRGGFGCNYGSDSMPGALEVFDENINKLVWPLTALNGENYGGYAHSSNFTIISPTDYDWISGGKCIWDQNGSRVGKYCPAATSATVYSRVADTPLNYSAVSFQQAILIPDPLSGRAPKIAFFQHRTDSTGNSPFKWTDHNGIAHTLNQAPSFGLWSDLTGKPIAWLAVYKGSLPFTNGIPGNRSYCYHRGQATVIAFEGGKNLYKLSMSSDPYAAPWSWSLWKTGAGGSSPSSGPTAPQSGGNPTGIGCLAGLPGEIVFMNTAEIWLHKD